MKKKLIYIFMLLCLFTIALPSSVRAVVEAGISVGLGDSVQFGGGETSPTQEHSWRRNPQIMGIGLRLTLTDKYGGRVSEPVDFFNKNNEGIFTNNLYTVSKKTSIVEHMNGTAGYDFNDMYSSSFTFNGKFNDKLAGGSFESSINYLRTLTTNPSKLLVFIKEVFGKQYSDGEVINKYILIEPILWTRITNHTFNNEWGPEFCASFIATSYEYKNYISKMKFSCKIPNPSSGYIAEYGENDVDWSKVKGTFLNYSEIDFYGTFHEGHFKGFSSTSGNDVGIIWLGSGISTCSDLSTQSKYKNLFGGSTGRKLKKNNSEISIVRDATTDHFIDVCTEKDETKACPPNSAKAGQNLLPKTCNATCNNSGTYDPKNCCDVACNSSGNVTMICKYFKDSNGFWVDGWKYSGPDNKVVSSTDMSVVRSECGQQYVCGPETTYAGKTITKEVYDSKSGSLGRYSNNRYDQACYRPPACTDFYNTAEDFRNVKLYPEATALTNCCLNYEGNVSTNLTRLYRDHPECYSCTYAERGINASCSKNLNSSSTGDLFGRGDKSYDEQTCAYYVAAGRINTTSSNLVTRRQINSVCKVVCTETVNVKFPLLAQKYYRKGSYIVWPTNVALEESESQLVLNGDTKCWYYVSRVRLNNLYNSNPNQANKEFKQCVDDVVETYNKTKNVIDYDLKGNFSVKYNDKEFGKTIALTRESSSELEITPKLTNPNANIGLLSYLSNVGVSRYNINDFINLVELIEYNVKQQVNYIIDPTSGYNFSYQGKYSTLNKWGNNAFEIGKSVLGLSSKTYNNGELKIDYSNIGGGSKKYSTTTNEYGVCKYETTDNIPLVCPDDTKNSGMRLDLIMSSESISYEEAVEKYCNNPDDGLTTCPEGTDYEGKKILKTCYDNETCRELTCNLHTCTDGGGVCHILNTCISRQMEDYGKSFDEAKNYCTQSNCGGNPGNIEYRVIDLKDPFPGEIARSGSSSFNTNIKGRKPGENWNSTTVVQREIINNRGVEGDAIYSTTPLYEFELTPSVIKEIRSYNDKNEYSDFTLNCKENNREACIASGFDFRNGYGIVNTIQQCRQINNLEQFNACYNNQNLH